MNYKNPLLLVKEVGDFSYPIEISYQQQIFLMRLATHTFHISRYFLSLFIRPRIPFQLPPQFSLHKPSPTTPAFLGVELWEHKTHWIVEMHPY